MSEIINLTPHAITIGDLTIPPSGNIARAHEIATAAAPIAVSIPDPAAAPSDRIQYEVATSIVRYIGTDLPSPRDGVYLVVSTITATAALDSGRSVDDLLVPGEPMRDASGRIVGCRSLARVIPPTPDLAPGWEDRAVARAGFRGALPRG